MIENSTPIDFIPPELIETHRRLQEWARWVRPSVYQGGGTSCCSLEGRYQHPRRENGVIICDECGHVTRVAFESECPACGWSFPPIETDRRPGPPVDTIQAMRVEQIVAALPQNYRLHLRLWYVHKVTPNSIRKRIAVRESELSWHRTQARMMVRNQLARDNLFRYDSKRWVYPMSPSDESEGGVPTEFLSLAC